MATSAGDSRGRTHVARADPGRRSTGGGLADHGRPVAVGEPANLTLVDPAAEWTVRGAELASLSANTPFEGHVLPARILATFLRGRPTVLDGRLQDAAVALVPR